MMQTLLNSAQTVVAFLHRSSGVTSLGQKETGWELAFGQHMSIMLGLWAAYEHYAWLLGSIWALCHAYIHSLPNLFPFGPTIQSRLCLPMSPLVVISLWSCVSNVRWPTPCMQNACTCKSNPSSPGVPSPLVEVFERRTIWNNFFEIKKFKLWGKSRGWTTKTFYGGNQCSAMVSWCVFSQPAISPVAQYLRVRLESGVSKGAPVAWIINIIQ